jgi:hypothetical protein
MIGKNCARAILCLCCTLLIAGAPTVIRAAEPQTQAAPNPKQGTLMCRNLDIPGSHIKKHVCGTPAQRSTAQGRLDLSRQNQAASIGAAGVNTPLYSPSVPGMSGFGTAASQASFQR